MLPADDDLRAAGEILDFVLEAVEDVVVVCDLEGRIVRANRAAHERSGYEPPTLLALRLADLVPADLMGEHGRMAAAVMGGERVRFDTERLHANGERVPVTITTAPVHAGGDPAAPLVGATLVLRERREVDPFLGAVVSSSADAIVGLDTERRVTVWNASAERLFGWAADEILGRDVDLIWPTGEADAGQASIARALAGERVRFEAVRRRKDGEELHVELHVAPVVDANGTILGTSSVARDLAERRRLEEVLRRSHRLGAMGQLAGGVVHDVNNLLTVIGMHTELALRSITEGGHDAEELGVVLDAVDRGARLTRSLLAFARRDEREATVIDVHEVLDDLLPLLRRALGKNVELVAELGETSSVAFDPTGLEQVVTNLALNGRDAMQPTGGRLHVETRNVRLDEAFAARHPGTTPGRYVRLSVRDEGCGMDAATRERLFEPFFTTKGPGEGTGLGLSTVYGLVKQAGGEVTVFSEPGHGATFRVFLPRSDEPVEKPRRARDEASMSSVTEPTETLVVVLSDASLRGAVRRTLSVQGYCVLDAADGAEAIARAQDLEGPVDAVLSDGVLPGAIGGEGVVGALGERNRSFGFGAPRLLYLGGVRDAARGATAAPVLPKPFTSDGLLGFVREALDG
ncbi:MAG: PAS domain S-box protein [Myxococcota bacterium]